MTVQALPRKAGPYIGTGGVSTYPFSFKTTNTAHVSVTRGTPTGEETTLTPAVHYTVALNLNQDTSPGGTITLLDGPLASNYRLTILSTVPYAQTTDIPTGGILDEKTLEGTFDLLEMQIQQLAERTDRAVMVPPTSQQLPLDFLDDLSGATTTAQNSAAQAVAAAQQAVEAAQQAVAAAEQATTVAGGTSAPTANQLIRRDGSGRAQVAAPSAAADIARLDTVTSAMNAHVAASDPHAQYATDAALTAHQNLTSAHGATPAPNPNTMVSRDAIGRTQVAWPSGPSDAANKTYVDGTLSAGSNGYLILPNGLKFVWGRLAPNNGAAVSGTFASSFLTVLNAWVSQWGSDVERDRHPVITSLTTTGITVTKFYNTLMYLVIGL